MKHAFRTIVISSLMLGSTAFAQTDDVGQVDLEPMAEAIGASPKVNLNFGPAMMRGFAESVRGSSPELAGILESVRGLRVMVFEDADSSAAQGRVVDTAAELSRAGWTPAIEVREDDTRVDLYLNESDKFVEGLVLMLTEGSETAVFANVYGELDPVVIGKLIGSGNGFGGARLENLAERFQSMSNGGGGDNGAGNHTSDSADDDS